MRAKNFVSIAFMFGLITLGWTYVSADPVVPKEFGAWQNAKVGPMMTIRVPGNFKTTTLPLDDETKKKIDSMETYTLDNSNADDYQCLVTFTTYTKSISADLEGGANGVIDGIKGDSSVSDFKVSKKYIHKFKMKGILLKGTLMSKGKLVAYQAVIFTKRNIAWMLMIVDATDNKLPQITDSIVNSLQIKAN